MASDDLDGEPPELQELQDLVPGPLLEGQQCPGFLLIVLVNAEDDPCPVLRLLVTGLFKEPL